MLWAKPLKGQCVYLQDELPGATVAALGQLCSLFGLRILDAQMGDFLEDGYFSGQQVTLTHLTHPSVTHTNHTAPLQAASSHLVKARAVSLCCARQPCRKY